MTGPPRCFRARRCSPRSRARPQLRRAVLRRRDDHRHLLPPVVPRARPEAGARRVLRDHARGARRRLPAVHALPAARPEAGTPEWAARLVAGRGRPGAADTDADLAPRASTRRPCAAGSGRPRHDLPGLLPRPAAGRRLRRPPRGDADRRGRPRPRLGVALRLPRRLPQAGRGAARRGGAAPAARSPASPGSNAARADGRRRDRRRAVPARVRRPAHDRDAVRVAAAAPRRPLAPATARSSSRCARSWTSTSRAGGAPSTCRSTTPAPPSSAASGTPCGASPTARPAPTPSSPARSAAGAARAVGTANGDNRLAIVVPCHRVVGADGALTGYGGGLWRKRGCSRRRASCSPRRPGADRTPPAPRSTRPAHAGAAGRNRGPAPATPALAPTREPAYHA